MLNSHENCSAGTAPRFRGITGSRPSPPIDSHWRQRNKQPARGRAFLFGPRYTGHPPTLHASVSSPQAVALYHEKKKTRSRPLPHGRGASAAAVLAGSHAALSGHRRPPGGIHLRPPPLPSRRPPCSQAAATLGPIQDRAPPPLRPPAPWSQLAVPQATSTLDLCGSFEEKAAATSS